MQKGQGYHRIPGFHRLPGERIDGAEQGCGGPGRAGVRCPRERKQREESVPGRGYRDADPGVPGGTEGQLRGAFCESLRPAAECGRSAGDADKAGKGDRRGTRTPAQVPENAGNEHGQEGDAGAGDRPNFGTRQNRHDHGVCGVG